MENIKLENIRKNASLSEKIDRILSEDNIENQYVMCQAIIEYINVKFLTSRLGKTLPDYNILTIMIEYEKIDEELYDNPPTLLFGTVDKFAMMPWDGRIGSFFGVGTDNRAPELIVQDELHLISGALGTMVGLYETAIDGLCSSKGVPEKIIASTATIRRANEQCSVLYDRDVAQFPAPGLNSALPQQG